MKQQLLYTLLLAGLLTGCGRATDDILSDREAPITFNAFIVEDGQARALAETRALGGDLANGYVLSAVLTSVDYNPGNNTPGRYPSGQLEQNRLFWMTPFAKNGSYGGGARYWDTSGETRHTFFAYAAAPAGQPAGMGVTGFGGVTNAHPVPYIQYMHPSDPAKQIDFLVADPVANLRAYPFAAPAVNLYFRHALSRLIFKLIGTGKTTLPDCQAQVTYKANSVGSYVDMLVPITDSYNTKTPFHSGTYNLGGKFTLPASASDAKTAVTFGEMILLPNGNLPDEFLTVTINYKDGAGLPKSSAISLPPMSFKSQRQYTLLFNIIETTENLTIASVTLAPWISQEGVVDELN